MHCGTTCHVKCSSNAVSKRIWDKQHACIYCSKIHKHHKILLARPQNEEEYHYQVPEQFQFCYLILEMQLVIFLLIRCFREGNFDMYQEALSELIPYFFGNNNVNFARWLPVHFRDMMSLEKQHPDVAVQFHKGKFVVHKSRREFSALAIDQAHEQNNAVIKGDGGAVGPTEGPVALRR